MNVCGFITMAINCHPLVTSGRYDKDRQHSGEATYLCTPPRDNRHRNLSSKCKLVSAKSQSYVYILPEGFGV